MIPGEANPKSGLWNKVFAPLLVGWRKCGTVLIKVGTREVEVK